MATAYKVVLQAAFFVEMCQARNSHANTPEHQVAFGFEF